MTCTTSSKVLYFPIFALAAALTACGDGGVDGTNIVFKTSAIAPGTECANGGTLFEAGLDANNNAVLDTNEISSRAAVCNGASGSGTGPAGPAGPQGPKGDDVTLNIG